MRKDSAVLESDSAIRDAFADLTVVDGRIATEENQTAGSETAQKMMAALVQQIAQERQDHARETVP